MKTGKLFIYTAIQFAAATALLVFMALPAAAEDREVTRGRIRISNPGAIYSLNGEWRFAPRDDMRYKEPGDIDANWDLIKVPGTWHMAGYKNVETGWYRAHVFLSPGFGKRDIGIMTPWVGDAHELYVNGHYIGGRGRISNEGRFQEIDIRYNCYHVPRAVLNTNGDNTIAFRISSICHGGGFYFENFRIGDYETILDNFLLHILRIGSIAFILIFLGLYQLAILIRRRKEKEYLYLAISSISLGIGMASSSTISFWLIPGFWVPFTLGHLSEVAVAYFFTCFIYIFFEYKRGLIIRIFRIFCIASSLLILTFSFDPRIFEFFVKVYQFIMLLVLAIAAGVQVIYIVIKSMVAKKIGAVIIGIGTIILTIAMINWVMQYARVHSFIDFLDYGCLAFIVSIAIAQAEKYRAMQMETERLNVHLLKTNRAYSRFVPVEFLKHLNRNDIVDVELGDQVQRDMTILFSDIRSFTAITEKMTPAESFSFINGFLGEVGPVVRKHNGFIDKYIGDAIMALFPGDPGDAIDAAIEMLRQVCSMNATREKDGSPAIRIGIGVHTGRLILGTVGERERMDSTVISDAVNLASRLEGLTKLYGASLIASEETMKLVAGSGKYHSRVLDRVKVKGKDNAVLVMEIYDGDDKAIVELKNRTRETFERGFGLYQERRFDDARDCFAGVLSISPGDTAVAMYIKRCDFYREHGVPLEWDGAESIATK